MFFDNKVGSFGAELNKNIAFVLEKNFHYLPQIFCVFSEKHDNSKRRAAVFFKTILEKLSFNDVMNIDTQMRETTSMEWFINWNKVEKSDLLLPTMTKEEKQAVLVFASFNQMDIYVKKQ